MNNRLLLIIPAYNEAKNIENVIKSLDGKYDYIIVNDGSTDNTAKICREQQYYMLDIPVNLGLAGAFQTALQYAYEHGYDYSLQFDGDGQHQPEYINGMLEYARGGQFDIVIGSRFLSCRKPFSLRMIGSRIISMLIWLTTGKTLSDPTSGMRLWGRRVVKYMAYESNMDPEPDTVAYLMKCGANVGEYPVNMKERENGESYLNLTASVKYMCKTCFSILLLQTIRERKKL